MRSRLGRLLGAVAAAFALAGSPAGATQKPPLVGLRAPQIVVPLIANGSGTFNLAQQHGSAVYINFFASWCKPCDAEAKTIEAVAAPYAQRGVQVIGIAVLDHPDEAAAFARDHGLTYPIAFDKSGNAGEAYRVEQLPLHVFIAADGRVKQYVPGGPIPAAELRAGLSQIAP